MKVAVIGAGVVGASVAFRLQQRSGVEVTLIDRSRDGCGTTGASFAWLNANRKLPKEYFDLNHAGLEEHLELQEELPETSWLHSGGNLVWTTDEHALKELEDRVERLQSWGYAAEWRKASEVNRDLEPNVAFPSANTPVAYFPHEAWVDAPLLASRLAELSGDAGAELRFEQSLEAVQTEGGRLRAILLSEGDRLAVDAMVNACGPRAAEVSSLAGVPLTIAPKSGLLVRLEVSGQPVVRLMHTEAVNVRPDTGGRVLVHHGSVDEMLWQESGATDKLAGVLLERARRILPPLEQAKISEVLVGTRPIPEDGFPCVGDVPDSVATTRPSPTAALPSHRFSEGCSLRRSLLTSLLVCSVIFAPNASPGPRGSLSA